MDALQQLKDIHLQAKPSLWPLAPGWWLLLGLFVLSAVAIIWRYQYKKANKDHKRLMMMWSVIEEQAEQQNAHQLSSQLNVWLKHVAISYFPEQSCASLSGQQWLDFLADSSGIAEFRQDLGGQFMTHAYNASEKNKDEINYKKQILALSKQWIERVRKNKARKKSSQVSHV